MVQRIVSDGITPLSQETQGRTHHCSRISFSRSEVFSTSTWSTAQQGDHSFFSPAAHMRQISTAEEARGWMHGPCNPCVTVYIDFKYCGCEEVRLFPSPHYHADQTDVSTVMQIRLAPQQTSGALDRSNAHLRATRRTPRSGGCTGGLRSQRESPERRSSRRRSGHRTLSTKEQSAQLHRPHQHIKQAQTMAVI